MNREVILTFDLGTTRLKVAAFDADGTLIGQVSRRNQEYTSGQLNWQSANQWWQDAVNATRELMALADLDAAHITGISLSGRAGAAVFVDSHGNVLHDPWSDNRHAAALASVTAGLEKTSAQYGPALLAKYCWLRDQQPGIANKVTHVLYAKDFLLFKLTHKAITDPSSGPDGDWEPALLERFGVDKDRLPAIALPWQIAGPLTPNAASALGLTQGTPVAVGAHDGISANIGAGAIGPGQYALTLGTHAVIRTISDTWPDGARRFYGFPPASHVIGGNALFAGRSLDWFVDNWFDQSEADRPSLFTRLDAAAATVAPGSNGLTFLPFLRGTIAPRLRTGARAAFQGLSLDSGRPEMYRAILEGSAFALRDIYNQLTGWTGVPTQIGVTGSGATSLTWTEILANVLQQPLTLTDGASEGRGAAICCATALGIYPSIQEAAAQMVRPTRVVEPAEEQMAIYSALHQRWLTTVNVTEALDR